MLLSVWDNQIILLQINENSVHENQGGQSFGSKRELNKKLYFGLKSGQTNVKKMQQLKYFAFILAKLLGSLFITLERSKTKVKNKSPLNEGGNRKRFDSGNKQTLTHVSYALFFGMPKNEGKEERKG